MSTLQIAGQAIEIDENGFMQRTDQWNEEVARELARREGYEGLDDRQLAIIRFMRDYYLKFAAFPILQTVCHQIHEGKGCINEAFINPEKAWKIAGLPKLDTIQFVPVEGEHYVMQECC
ncbi:MAG: TusE/DsrC/DsvC family sulfur relay protein [Thermodesulfobacteriota bacterium]